MDQSVQATLENFFSKYKLLKYRQKDLLIRAEDEPLGIFYLKEGLVREYVDLPNGQELTLNIFKPQTIFPLSYAVNGSVPAHNFEAVVPSVVFRAPVKDTLGFVTREPLVLLDLVGRIYKGLDGFFQRVIYQMAGSARSKLIIELVIQARRFGLKQKGAVVIEGLTHRDLASRSGLARETVGKILKGLKTDGLVDISGRKIVVKDLPGLEGELSL